MKKFRSNYDDDKYKLVRVGRLGLERSTGGSLTGTRPARNVINGMVMIMTIMMTMMMVMMDDDNDDDDDDGDENDSDGDE